MDFNPGKNILEISQSGLLIGNSSLVMVHGCDINLFRSDFKNQKSITIYVNSLCESDDDKANYCIDKNKNGIPWEDGDVDGSLMPNCESPISNANHICIDPGEDLTLDLYTQINDGEFWQNKDNDPSRPNDIIDIPDLLHEVQILPSYNEQLTNPYFCNERPRMNNIASCPNLSQNQKDKIENDLNAIYSKAGISINVIFGTQHLNFDAYIDDNEITSQEQNLLHLSLFGGTSIPLTLEPATGNYIWLVDKIFNNTNDPELTIGRATAFGWNTSVVDYDISNPRTIAHEIGHSIFALNHPDGSAYMNDGLGQKVEGDSFNYMNSGLNQNTVSELKKFRIRRYQWIKMRN